MSSIPRLNFADGVFPTTPDSHPIVLGQSWRSEPEEDLKPTVVRVGWTSGHLWVFAELADEDVFNDATQDNQRTWKTGDVFEVFWKTTGVDGYHEVHVTPDNVRLSLSFPVDKTINAVRAQTETLDTYFQPTEVLLTRATKTRDGWSVIVGIPRANSTGDSIDLSFCRYDAHRDRPPTISSSSPHPVEDFHRPQDWASYTLR